MNLPFVISGEGVAPQLAGGRSHAPAHAALVGGAAGAAGAAGAQSLPDFQGLSQPSDPSGLSDHADPQGFQGFKDLQGQPALPKKRSLLWLAITLGVLALLLVAAYVGLAVYFMSHFTFNTTVNGASVAFQTAGSVNETLAHDSGSYALDIEARGGERARIAAGQIGLSYVGGQSIERALEDQQEWAWPLALFAPSGTDIENVGFSFDREQLGTALAALPFMETERMRPPVDATLSFEGDSYVIVPGDEGTTLDLAATTRVVADAIDAGQTSLVLDEAGVYARPAVAADDPSLLADRDRYNQYVPFQITYVLGEERVVLNGSTTINWVNTEGEPPYAVNPDAVRAWVAELAARYDTLGATRAITNGLGEVKQVTGGTFGWQLDQEAEINAILTAAAERRSEEREPYWLSRGAAFGENDWGGTYLEVDISQQHMWCFVDGVCVLETDVITGNPNNGYATPEGVWSVFLRALDMETKGDPLPGGGYEWGPDIVRYWMQFTQDGCGFHDATWQSSFGGDAYLYRGSHGCINMPYDMAGQLYDIVQVGIPVITHH